MDDTKPKDQQLEEQAGVDQAAIDAAAAAISGEKPEETVNAVRVEEHPISDDEAKKYVGVGDFALPTKTASLDDLIGTQRPAAPAAGDDAPQPSTTKPALDKLTAPQAGPMPLPKVDAKDLEKKAQDMLKALDETGKKKGRSDESLSPKPKRRGSGAAVRMALAAVLVVMMGAGGVVGMNLLKMQQSAENRSKAGADIPGYCCTPDPNGSCDAYGHITCTGPNGCVASIVCGNNKRCNCCDTDGTVDWTEGEGADCSAVCKSKGFADVVGGAACPAKNECYCESWANGCGVNCHFPGDTQGKVTAAAQAACSPKIAMCDLNTGAISIVDYNPSNPCWNKVDKCRNPYDDGTCASEFSCSGLTADRTSGVKVGDTVTFTCSGSGTGISRYEFRYSIDGAAYQTLATSGTNPAKSVGLTVQKAGSYKVQCRACNSAGTCTPWGLAK